MPDPLGPITAGRRGAGLLSFRVGPIPVTIHLSFLLVLAFLGLGLSDPVLIAVWVVVGAASVLLHELGHATGALLAGHEPTVDLAGMGGVTTYDLPAGREQGRGWGLVITAAGPGVQILAGVAAYPLVGRFGLVYRGDLVEFALSVWVVVSLLWGVLNLVPILPLDGGQLFRNLLPGGPAARTRIAEAVSVVLAGAGALWALAAGQAIAALLAGWFGFANLQSLLAARRRAAGGAADAGADGGAEAGVGGPDDGTGGAVERLQAASRHLAAGEPEAAARLAGEAVRMTGDRRLATMGGSMALSALLQAGRARDAYRVVADPRHGLAFNEVLVGHALSAHPDRRAIQDVLVRAGRRGEPDARLRGITAVVAALHGHPEVALRELAAGPVSDDVRNEVARLVGRRGR